MPYDDELGGIVDFLDRETAEADALVAKYERLIELLEEKRVALIRQAVTKGLDASVPMKDSGLEWVGAIPNHWNTQAIARISKSVLTGKTPKAESLGDEGVPWFTPGDILENALSHAVRVARIRRVDAIADGLAIYPAGSVLIVCIGNIGNVMTLAGEATSNQQINAILPNHNIDARFLAYTLNAARSELRAAAVVSLLPILNQTRLKSVHVPVPPLPEQRSIAAELDIEMKRHFSLVEKARSAISLISERRGTVITAAVTGLIDVSATLSQSLGAIV